MEKKGIITKSYDSEALVLFCSKWLWKRAEEYTPEMRI